MNSVRRRGSDGRCGGARPFDRRLEGTESLDGRFVGLLHPRRPRTCRARRQSASPVLGRATRPTVPSGNQGVGSGVSRSQPAAGDARGQPPPVLRGGVNTGGVSSTVRVHVDETPFGSSSGLVNGHPRRRLRHVRHRADRGTARSARDAVWRQFAWRRPKVRHQYAAARPLFGPRAWRPGSGQPWRHRLYVNGVVVNAPLGTTSAFRASGFYRKERRLGRWTGANANFLGIPSVGGKDINDSKIWGGRGSLLFKPSEP